MTINDEDAASFGETGVRLRSPEDAASFGETGVRLRSPKDAASFGETGVRLRSPKDAASFGETWPFGFDPSLSADGNLLRTAIHLASVQIREAAVSSHDCAGMGTTIVAARVAAGRLSVAHVGDSRLYLVAGRTLRQMTQDDSWMVSMLAHDPAADPLLLEHHPLRNALTNVIGATSRTEVHVVEHALAGGELLLLSTDGVHSVLDGSRLERIVLEEDEPRAIAHAMISAALTRGSRDNCTAVVARYVKT